MKSTTFNNAIRRHKGQAVETLNTPQTVELIKKVLALYPGEWVKTDYVYNELIRNAPGYGIKDFTQMPRYQDFINVCRVYFQGRQKNGFFAIKNPARKRREANDENRR